MSKKVGGNKKGSLSVKEYEKLGRTLESIFEGGYINHRRVYQINFLRGVFFGLGSILGGTILVGVVAWILSFFTEVPILGRFVETVQNTVEQ